MLMPRSWTTKPAASEQGGDHVLADVVDVTEDRADHDDAEALLLNPAAGDFRLEDGGARSHGLGGSDQVGQPEVAAGKTVADGPDGVGQCGERGEGVQAGVQRAAGPACGCLGVILGDRQAQPCQNLR